MTATGPNESSHLLSVLIFSPLAAAAVAALIRNERLLRLWTLAFTSAVALFSLQLYWRFDPETSRFQFAELAHWIPWLRIDYAVGIDGISLLLVLLTTLIMPLCVMASWRYIQTRVREFMICLLVMETAMVLSLIHISGRPEHQCRAANDLRLRVGQCHGHHARRLVFAE